MERFVTIPIEPVEVSRHIGLMIFESSSIRQFLNDELARRVRVNPNYSLRSFARNLSLSPGELSELLRNKRNLSMKSADKIARALGMNTREKQHLVLLAQKDRSVRLGIEFELEDKEIAESNRVPETDFSKISEWYHFAILNLFDLKDFCWNVRWISRKLNLSLTQTKIAMSDLIECGLVRKINGEIVTHKDYIVAGGEMSSMAVKRYHKQLLQKAQESVEEQAFDKRSFDGIGFCCDLEDLPKIKKEVAKFLDILLERFHKKGGKEIYQMETALFRLTSGGSDNV